MYIESAYTHHSSFAWPMLCHVSRVEDSLPIFILDLWVRSKWRGFGSGAATCHSQSARVHRDFRRKHPFVPIFPIFPFVPIFPQKERRKRKNRLEEKQNWTEPSQSDFELCERIDMTLHEFRNIFRVEPAQSECWKLKKNWSGSIRISGKCLHCMG